MTYAVDPVDRVRYVLEVARRLADPTDALGVEARRDLDRTSGLSPEGVELALTTALETSAAESDLESLVAWAESAPRCHVVMSSNVCTAAVRAVALAVAASDVVFVKASRRDPGLARLLARALDPRAGEIALVDRLQAREGDHVHAYGSDVTLETLKHHLGHAVRLRAHGTGFGVAFVGPGADLEQAARGLARDVVLFDQAGCLSPRAAFVVGAQRARTFAAALDVELTRLGRDVPLGPGARAALPEVALYAEAMRALGPVLAKDDHTVTLDDAPSAWVLAPACRVVPVLALESPGDALALLGEQARFVTNVGVADPSDDALRRVAVRFPGARLSSLGAMQSPPLDGPVDRRPGRG